MQDQYRLACGLADSAIMEAQLWHHFASVEAPVWKRKSRAIHVPSSGGG